MPCPHWTPRETRDRGRRSTALRPLMLSDRTLMEMHVGALYRLDAQNRLLSVNEPGDPQSPPRLFFGRTREGHLWRFAHDLPESVVDEVEPLLRAEPITPDFSQPPR